MLKYIVFLLVGLFLVIILKQLRPEYSFLTRLAVISVSVIALIGAISELLSSVRGFVEFTQMQSEYISIMTKVLGITIVAQIAGDTCRDCGESALATQVEFIGKIAVAAISLPIIEKLIELSVSLISG